METLTETKITGYFAGIEAGVETCARELVEKLKSDSQTSSKFYLVRILELAYGLDAHEAYDLLREVDSDY